jgi:hypothetical protein
VPRLGTTDTNAELAVRLYGELLDEHVWGLDRAWLAISALLMTCDAWCGGDWYPLYDAPVLRESNVYGLTRDGEPNAALVNALRVKERLAEEFDVPADDVCAALGRFFREPRLLGVQPNNPRGHAFRSLVAETLVRFGDPALDVIEGVTPGDLFPDFDRRDVGRDSRIDIVVLRDSCPVTLITTHWTYRHTRVGMLKDAEAYMPLARQLNERCRFYGVTAEFMTARLKKVIAETAPVMRRNAAIDRLVHLNPELPGDLIGRNGDLREMWSLEQMVRDSLDWE